MQSFPPRVSVVITSHKSKERLLRDAIEGALAQDYTDFEIIVSDNSSMDETKALVESYKDSRLRYIPNPGAIGPAANHWTAIQAAKAEYIAVLSHDDRWKPRFLSQLVRPLDTDKGVVLTFCDHNIIDDSGKFLPANTEETTRLYKRDQLPDGCCASFPQLVINLSVPMSMGAVFRKSALRPESEEFFRSSGPAYDLCLLYFLSLNNSSAYYVKERLADYRIALGNLTSQNGVDWAYGAALCWQEAMKQHQFKAYIPELSKKAANSLFTAAKRSADLSNRTAAIDYALQGLRLRFSLEGVAALIYAVSPYWLRKFLKWVASRTKSATGENL